jgi:LysM repeat protein
VIRPSAFAALLLALVLGPWVALAAERSHEVRPGESASTIAQQHYGDATLGAALLRYNGKHGTTIRAGEMLRVPYCEIHVVSPGESWSALAKRYLGRTSGWRAIAELNGFDPQQPLAVNTRVIVPVPWPHTLRRGETLAALSERFYGDRSRVELLRSFNGIDDPRRLAVGQHLEIPLVTMLLRQELRTVQRAEPKPAPTPAPTPTSTKTVAKKSAPPEPEPVPAPVEPRYTAQLARAERQFERGDYAAAERTLTELEQPVAGDGAPADRAELARLLAFVLVAFDRLDEACAAYRDAAQDAPRAELDVERVSPKIRRALASCDASGS